MIPVRCAAEPANFDHKVRQPGLSASVCVLAMYIPHATGSPTIDHVVPKSYAWAQVYEWSNYRLCAAIVNSKKGDLQTIVDPFEVKVGWFELELASFRVRRGRKAPKREWKRIDATLPLLNIRDCCKEREEYVNATGSAQGGGALTSLFSNTGLRSSLPSYGANGSFCEGTSDPGGGRSPTIGCGPVWQRQGALRAPKDRPGRAR